MTDLHNAVFGEGDLAILSLQVAQQVDRRLSHKAFDPTTFARFAEELSRASGITREPSVRFLQANPAATDVLARAVSAERRVSEIPELVEAIRSIVDSSKNLDENKSSDEFTRLKNFCLALHRSMMARRLPPRRGDRGFEESLGIFR